MSSMNSSGRKAISGIAFALTAVILVTTLGGFWSFWNDLFSRGSRNEPRKVLQVVTNQYLSEYYHGGEDDHHEDYWAPFVAAVLYDDGTVEVSCKKEYSSLYSGVSGWTDIQKLWLSGSMLLGLQEDGRLCCSSGYDTASLRDVADLVAAGSAYYVIHTDGSVSYLSPKGEQGYPDPTVTGWKNVQKMLPYSTRYSEWGYLMLRKDGTVASSGSSGIGSPLSGLSDVQDILMVEGMEVAIKKDGSLVCFGSTDPEADKALAGSVRLAYGPDGVLFGVTCDGELKLSCGIDHYNSQIADGTWYLPIEAERRSKVKDILDQEEMRSGDIVLLYEDGTLFSPVGPLNEIISGWNDIQKIGWYEGYTENYLYGLRGDGTVVTAKIGFGYGGIEVYENYQSWILEDLYIFRFSGCIGLGNDGSFVGDHAFENLDLQNLKKGF